MATYVSFKLDLFDAGLRNALSKLPKKLQSNVVRTALRRSAKRAQMRVIQAVSGNPIGIRTGRLLTAFAASRLKSFGFNRRRGTAGYGVELPSREALGIDRHDKWYYPAVLEYGAPPRLSASRFMRDAIDKHHSSELLIIGSDIGKGINNQWRRLARQKGK